MSRLGLGSTPSERVVEQRGGAAVPGGHGQHDADPAAGLITGGENVYPAEVENILFGHPAIRDVAVIGLPDPRWGEAVVAVVVPAPGHTVQLEELREFGGRSLARCELPTQLQVVNELPRNPAGKVLKYELRRNGQAAAAS